MSQHRDTPPPRRVNPPVRRPGAGENGSGDPLAEPAMGWYDRSGDAAAAPETAREGTSVGLPELFDPPERAEPPPPPPPPVEDWPEADEPTAYPVADQPTAYPTAAEPAEPVAALDLDKGAPPIIEPRVRTVRTVDKAPPIVSAIVVAIALLAVAVVGTLLRGASAEDTKPRAPAAVATPATRKATPTRTVSPLVRGIIVRAQRGPVSLSAKLPTGQLLFSGVLPQGTYRRFPVPKLIILVGDAGAADVYVNGVRRPRLGLAGHPVQLVVTAPV